MGNCNTIAKHNKSKTVNEKSKTLHNDSTLVEYTKEKHLLILDCKTKTQDDFPTTVDDKSKTLVAYAKEKLLILDESRESFLCYHDKILHDLSCGNLKDKNRFRHLLLGVKSVGKTKLLKCIKDYTRSKFGNIITIFISCTRLESMTSISQSIMDALSNFNVENIAKLNVALQGKSKNDTIETFESFLLNSNIKVLLLVDEFQFVYTLPTQKGHEIIEEISELVGTESGVFHCIITGSSSCLRSLAFAKLAADEDTLKTYPSYRKGYDLNSTKLQPRWIYPLDGENDFRALCERYKVGQDENDLVRRYLYSRGRPGLAIVDIGDELPYSVSVKHFGDSNELCGQILREIANGTSTFNNRSKQKDIFSVLVTIPEDIIYQRVGCPDRKNYMEALYNLCDHGLIKYSRHTDNWHTISLTSVQNYFELEAENTLTWKDAAALKMPTGYFHEIAEKVAMRYISQKISSIFKIDIETSGVPTILDFGECNK